MKQRTTLSPVQRPSEPKPKAGRKVARTDPALKEAGQPAAPPVERSTEAGGTRQGPERTSRRTCVSKPPLPQVLHEDGRRRLSRASRSLLEPLQRPPRLQSSARYVLGPDPRPYWFVELLLRDAKRRAGQDVSSSSESMDDDDEGGGPAQGVRETLYPFGSWICYFCEQVNGPALEDCSTFDPDGRVCPGHRGSSRGSPPIDPATIPVDADVAARRDQRRADKVAFRKEQAMAVSEALASFYTHTCGEWNLSFRNKCWKCSSKKGQAVEVPGCGRAQRVRGLRERP